MRSKSDNVVAITYENVMEVNKEIFESLISRYQSELETSIRGSDLLVVLVYDNANVIK